MPSPGPGQWNDTFVLLYGNKEGDAAYREAIDQTHFGTIYLTLNTVNGKKINEYLTNSQTPYRLSKKVPFYRHGQYAGALSCVDAEGAGTLR